MLNRQNNSTQELTVLKEKEETCIKQHKAGQAQLLTDGDRE